MVKKQSEDYSVFFIGILFTILNKIPVNEILLLVIKIFGLYCYEINHRQKIRQITSLVKISSMCDENNQPSGIIFGLWFGGYINEKGECKIIMFKKQFDEISDIPDEPIIKTFDSMKIMLVTVNFNGRHSVKPTLIKTLKPRPGQKKIVDAIIKGYKTNGVYVAFIESLPGKGKSSVALIIASQLKCFITKTYSPFKKEHELSYLQSNINSNYERPLVVLLDEIGEHIVNLKIEKRSTDKIEIFDKQTFNSYFDDIQSGLMGNIIVILTSNISSKEINDIDLSYLRLGRISGKFKL